MRSRILVLTLSIILVLGFAGVWNSVFAKQPDPLKKEQILRSINLLRSMQKQSPLSFAKSQESIQLMQAAGGSGAIAGTLLGIHDDGIYFAVVVAWSADSTSNSGTANFAKVDPGGAYRIDNLETGEYYVLALADGYLPKFYDNVIRFSEATTVQVFEGSVTEGIDFEMERILPGTASVTGVVLSEHEKTPIANAFVTVFSPENPFSYGWAETSEDGSYKIMDLKSGKYYASVQAEGYLTEFYDNAESIEDATLIEVVEPNETSNINFSLSRGGIISGVVLNDDGVAIAGAYVEAMSQFWGPDPTHPDSIVSGGWASAFTDENGKYQIGGLSTGDYLVSAQAWNQWNYVMEWYDNAPSPHEATPVHVEAGQEIAGIDFQLSLPLATGEIIGKVTDLQDQPIAGAYVQAQAPFHDPTGRVEVWAYAYTDQEGHYRIENLPNGRYLVSASAQSGWQFVQRWWPDAETPDQAQPVEVNGFTDLIPIDFKLPITMGSANISGKVLSDSGRPLAFAFVQVSPPEPNSEVASNGVWAYAYSDSNGYFEINQLPAGTYFAQAQYWENQNFGQQWYDHADSRTDATPINLIEGENRNDINFDLTIRPFYGAISGTVTNEETGLPVYRAYVEISPVSYDYFGRAPIRFWSYYAITDAQGNYKLEWLPEAEYLVSVYADGAFEYFENAVVAEQATPVKVTGGTTTSVNFGVLPRNEGTGRISGKVTGEWQEAPLEIAVVIARPAVVPRIWPDSEMFFNAVTNLDGTYEITGLPPGEYYLFSFAPGYIGEYYDNVFDPAEATLVKVDGINPTTDIDFSLMPMLILKADLAARPQSGATLFGRVADQDDKGIRDATIYLLNDAGQPIAFARSNSGGNYEIKNIPPGKYRLKASHIGHHSKYNHNANSFAEAVPIEVAYGRVEVNFTLEPASITGVKDRPNSVVPEAVELYGNYPNPFNPETRISFGLPAEMHVQLRIFNLLGQEVRRLYDGVLGAGVHNITWDGQNQFGESMPSGIYFYQLQTHGQRIAGNKMTLLR